MKAQTNNLVIAREIKFGAQPVPTAQSSVCAISLYGMNWVLPSNPTRANRTVVDGGGYRSRLQGVIDP